MFRRFDHWLKNDTYCTTVDEALSKDIEALNGFNYISDGVKWHRSAQLDGEHLALHHSELRTCVPVSGNEFLSQKFFNASS